MKIKISFYIVLCVFVAAFLITGCTSNIVSVPVTVNFGSTPKGGGPCSGKGICGSVAQPAPGVEAAGVAATMQVSKDKSALILKFSLADLKKKQPEQAANFTDGGSYNFDGAFDLGDPMYAPLGLAARARIEPATKNTVAIKGDEVTVTYNYAHE